MSLASLPGPTTSILLGACCGFLLKTAAGYALCVLISRVLATPSTRFAVWLLYLGSASGYWLISVARVLADLRPHTGISFPGSAYSSAYGGMPLPLPASIPLNGGAAHRLGQLAVCAAALYGGGLVAMLLIGLLKRARLAAALHYRLAPSEQHRELFRAIAAEMHAPPHCALWLLPGLPSPASLGWARPAVYLPADVAVSPAALGDVLRHELAHLRRRDAAWEEMARFCRGLLFFHPFAYKAFTSLRLERELACDRIVIHRNPGMRAEYAEMLLHFSWRTSLADKDAIGIGFTTQATILNARVRSILAGVPRRSRSSWALRILTSSAAGWLFVATVPALWIGFSFPSAPAAVATFSLQQPSSGARRHPVHVSSAADSLPNAAGSRGAALPPAPGAAVILSSVSAPRRPRAPGFHVQNEDEPMFDPPGDAGTSRASASEGNGRPGEPAKISLPSVTATITTAMMRLGRQGGGGGDRDHDHD